MAAQYSESSPIVQTTHGPVRGTLLKSIYDEQFYGFDGIPYALPPLGELRFRAPQPSKPWDNILDCTKPRAKCLQLGSVTKQIEGSEDCLYLNISVKTLKSDKPLPVMVYIHGGAFKGGDSTRRAWSPDYLMWEEVVYISIGYRLGPFGFLSFADPALNIPGNAGLKDVVLALQWIKANVANFNGDANNITLFGHSSGSMMAQLLMLSPQTEGLFDKVILMAGYMPEINRLPNLEYRLAKSLGYEGDNVDAQVYEFINNVDPKLLPTANMFTELEQYAGLDVMPYSPSVEPYQTPAGLIYAEPVELQRNAWSNRLPLMLGTTSAEGLWTYTQLKNEPKRAQAFRDYPEFLLPRTLTFHPDAKKLHKLGQLLVEKFCGTSSEGITEEHYMSLVNVKSHSIWHYENRVIQARRAYSTAPTYLYRFDFDSPDCNLYRIRFNGLEGPASRGTGHVDELCFLFKIPASFKVDKSRPEYTTFCRMAAIFVEFALRSNPNAPLIQSLVDWQPLSREGCIMCLNINEELCFIPQPNEETLKFYDQMYEQLGIDLI